MHMVMTYKKRRVSKLTENTIPTWWHTKY